jgi:TonB-linked SusC/RagA family outer membrane protein
MKKKHLIRFRRDDYPFLRKTFLIMKITLILLTLGLCNITASVYSQSAKINLNLQNVTLKEALDQIEKASNYKFLYRSDLVDMNNLTSLNARGTSLENVLNELFSGMRISYSIMNNDLVVLTPLQQNRVTGVVTDATSGEPLIGVNVTVEGTTIGTITDVNGKFVLDVSQQNAVLVFSYIGYNIEKFNYTGQAAIDLKMIPDIKSLNELVVIGYGTMLKSDLTGSVTKIGADDVRKTPSLSMESALQGRASGVMVTQASSAPGGGISVRIRGGNSIQGGNEPLYVIDGLPVYSNNNEVNPGGGQFNELRTAPNALASLNPSDIESIEVLKDASATAIYGSRGANGVILVTTKRGKAGGGKVEFDASYGIQNITKRVKVLNASELMQWANEGSVNGGQTAPFTQEQIDNPAFDTDWQNEILRSDAPTSNYQLTMTGGSDRMTYAVSGNYYNQEGIIKNSGFDRYSLRLNLDAQVNKWLKVGDNFSFARTVNNQAFEGGSGNANSSALFSSLAYIPMLPVYNPTTGNYSRREDGIVTGYSPYNRRNPVQLINEMTDVTISDRILGSIYADFTLLDGLTFRTNVGLDLDSRERNYYFSGNKDPFNLKGSASLGYAKALSLINTNMLTYNKTLGSHRLTVTGVYEVQKRTTDRSSMSNSIFDNDITMFYDIAAGTQTGGPGISSSRSEWTMASYLGRINYILKDKYLVTISARADGSSKFGADNRWGFFPSAAVAWKAGEEPFIKSLNMFSTLKIRASAGRTGNQEIGINQAVTRFSRGKYSFGGQEANFYFPTVGNTNLKWETTNQVDVGFDMGIFNERLTLTFDAYYKKTFDLLMTYNIPSELGYGSTTGNVGTLENKGIELTLGGWIVDNKDFKWKTDINWAANRNKVLSLGSSTELRGAVISYDYGSAFSSGNLVRVGAPVGSFYGLKTDGIYATQEEIDNNTLTYSGGAVPNVGSARYKDLGGPEGADGKLTGPDGKVDLNDRVILGDPNPDFIYGWSNTFTYKFVELSAFIQGVFGNEILNLNRRDLYDEMFQHNISKDRYDNAWRPDNTTAKYPRANANIGIVQRIPAGVYSDFFVEDGSYLRLKNVRLTVAIPSVWMKNKGIGAKVYFSGQNLVTITNYSGYNPEVNQQGQNNVNQGIDMGSYPLAKSYLFGINLSF